MTIPKSYEGLAADLASEKILSKTLLGQKEAYMMLADNGGRDLIESKTGASALREGLTTARRNFDYDRGFSAGSAEVETFRIEREALQQRLTVAEQRAGVMEKALTRIAREHDCGCWPCTWSCTSRIALEIAVDAMRDIAISALKPAEEGEGS